MADYSAYAPALKGRCQKHLDANPGATATPWLTALECLPWKLRRVCNLKALVRGMPEEFALANIRAKHGRRQVMHVICFSCTHGSPARAAEQEQEPHAADQHWCALCKVQCTSAQGWQGHISGQSHKARLLQRTAQQQYGGMYEDKQGITVSQLPEEAVGLQAGLSYTLELTVANTNGWAVAMQGCGQLPLLQEVQVLGGEPAQLAPGASLKVQVCIKPRGLGYLRTMLVLDFGSFAISRLLVAACDTSDPSLPDIRPSAPYTPKPRPKHLPTDTVVVPGEKPPRVKGCWKRAPGSHKMPKWLQQANGIREAAQRLKNTAADTAGHADKLALLLFVEELQQQLDVRAYDIPDATFIKAGAGGRYLVLEVPGLAENRPSVLRGDALYAVPADEAGCKREYQGFVHNVNLHSVDLRFDPSFHARHINGRRHCVRFTIKRSTFIFMHEALGLLRSGGLPEALVLPAGVSSVEAAARAQLQDALQARRQVISWQNQQLNPEQRAAVHSVVGGDHAPLPLIIYGPPGTGKTSTLIEAATQVRRTDASSRLLLIAPSNNAADLLAERMLAAGTPRSELTRINGYQRSKESVSKSVQDVCNWDDQEGAFALPEAVAVMCKRVVVVTCIMAAKLYARGVPCGHFSHIMMDEAGHAEEPLALAGLAGLAGPGCKVVLAGDPQQLGPVVHSLVAKQGGLGLSLLERLMAREPYLPYGEGTAVQYDARYICKLVRNYRAHPQLLELPSRLFYSGQLEAFGDPIITHSLLHWPHSQDTGCGKSSPLLFHGLVGKDEREGNSPSWFNSMEALQVLKYVQALMADRKVRLNDADIGVISPYHKQCQKLRTLLKAKGLYNVQVGSVEQYQGQERKVIIISTVRSSTQLLAEDAKFKLGFVASPKRFNVSITRAKALVVVVGNPAVLVHDPCWLALLRSAVQLKAYTGTAPLPPEALAQQQGSSGASGGAVDDLAALLQRMQGLSMSGEGGSAAAEAAAVGSGLLRQEADGAAWQGSAVNIEGGAMRRLDG